MLRLEGRCPPDARQCGQPQHSGTNYLAKREMLPHGNISRALSRDDFLHGRENAIPGGLHFDLTLVHRREA